MRLFPVAAMLALAGCASLHDVVPAEAGVVPAEANVVPAEAGTQPGTEGWIPASAGMTTNAGMAMTMAPLAAPGDPARGREVFVAREGGHCVICHAAPGIATAGDVGPSLAGVGSRLDAGQIRLRIADITRVNPQAAMPAFHRTAGLVRVAPDYRGKPVLSAQQVEDLVAWLGTLR